MKKLMALFLSLCMLMSMACAENAFTQGLDALLDSIRPGRDMLTLAFQGEQPVTVCLRTEGDMTDITAEMPGGVVHVQVEGHDIYLTAGERAMHLNLDELTGAAGQGMQMDPGVAGELIQLMLEKLIMPFATVNMNEGLHIAYRADGADLLSALAEVLDSVITEEKYARMLEQFMSFLGTVSGEAMPALEQIRESWPQVREEMVNQETDFHIAFGLDADWRMRDIHLTGEMGPEDDLYLIDWKILSENGRTTVDGKCSERITWSDNVRNYDLDIHGEMYRGIWSLDISYPARNLHLTAEGSHLDTMGRFSVTRTVPRTQSVVMQIQGTYVHMDDAFNCSLSIMDRINGSWSVSALVGEDILDVKAMDATGRQSMALKLLKAGDTLASGSFRLRSQRNEYALVYDGEKAVISMDGQTVTCTWGTESDQAFVVRLHPEDTVDGTQDDRDMLGRMEYTGQEGDFTVTATLTDAEGGEVIRAELKCQPSDGIHEKIADMENLVHVTPEMILSLLGR